jgi:hypothetical protein
MWPLIEEHIFALDLSTDCERVCSSITKVQKGRFDMFEEELLNVALDAGSGYLNMESLLKQLDNPVWNWSVGDEWENCVPTGIRELWGTLPFAVKLAVYSTAAANTRSNDD